MITKENISDCRKILKAFNIISKLPSYEAHYKRLISENRHAIQKEASRLSPDIKTLNEYKKELTRNQENLDMLETLLVFKETVTNIQNLYQKSTLL